MYRNKKKKTTTTIINKSKKIEVKQQTAEVLAAHLLYRRNANTSKGRLTYVYMHAYVFSSVSLIETTDKRTNRKFECLKIKIETMQRRQRKKKHLHTHKTRVKAATDTDQQIRSNKHKWPVIYYRVSYILEHRTHSHVHKGRAQIYGLTG